MMDWKKMQGQSLQLLTSHQAIQAWLSCSTCSKSLMCPLQLQVTVSCLNMELFWSNPTILSQEILMTQTMFPFSHTQLYFALCMKYCSDCGHHMLPSVCYIGTIRHLICNILAERAYLTQLAHRYNCLPQHNHYCLLPIILYTILFHIPYVAVWLKCV